MSTDITGVVSNGVVVPSSPLPEGTRVINHADPPRPEAAQTVANRFTLAQLRKMPRAERQGILAAAAAWAEEDYRDDKELTGFDAFSKEDIDAE